MDIINNYSVRSNAEDRQYPNDGLGVICAKCGDRLVNTKSNCNYIARIPIALGGKRNTENCIVVCDDCFKSLTEYDGKTIPFSILPFYNRTKA